MRPWVLPAGLLAAAIAAALVLSPGARRAPEPAPGSPQAGAARENAGAAAPFAPQAPGTARSERPPGAASIRLSGVVLDYVPQDGGGSTLQPAADVAVDATRVRHPWSAQQEFAPASGRSDAQGRFELAWDDPGDEALLLRAWLPENEQFRFAVAEQRLAPGEKEARMELRRARHGLLAGRALAEDGTPLPGVQVVFQPQNGGAAPIERLTDGDGRYAIPGRSDLVLAAARKDGWRLVRTTALTPLLEGGFLPFELILAPAARLAVRVTQGEDEPLEGATVELYPDVAGRNRMDEDEWNRGAAAPLLLLRAQTGADGRAEFADVWAGQRMVLYVYHPGGFLTYRWRAGDELLQQPRPEAPQALVLEAGESRTWQARLGRRVRVHGRVVGPEHHPVAASLLVEAPPLRPGELGGIGEHLASDENGVFERILLRPEPIEAVDVSAADGDLVDFGENLNRFGISRRVPLRPGQDDVELELVLQPLLPIAGTLRLDTGAPLQGQVLVLLAGEPEVGGRGGLGRTEWGLVQPETGFRVTGLLPGRYDLIANAQVPDHPELGTLHQRFTDIEAGDTALDLRMASGPPVDVFVEVVDPEPDLRSLLVLASRLQEDRPPGAPPADGLIDDPAGWPPGALLNFYGGGTHSDALGMYLDSVEQADGSTHKMRVCMPGWYWIGVQAFGANRPPYWPTGTGLVYLTPGEHHFRFVLRRTGTLPGRFRGALPADWVLSLEDGARRRIPLHNSNSQLAPTLLPGAAGEFLLFNAPSGRYTLLLGPEGAPARASFPIEILPGDNPEIELPLP